MINNLRVTDSQRQALLIGMDLLLLFAGVTAASWLAQQHPIAQANITISGLELGYLSWFWVSMLLGAWFFFGWLSDLYDVRSAHIRRLSIARVAIVVLLSVLGALLVAFLFQIVFPGAFLLFHLGIGLLLIAAWRIAYAALHKTSAFVRRVVIVGTGLGARTIAKLLEEEQGLRYEVLGYVSEVPGAEAKMCGGLPVWNVTKSLLELVRGLEASEVVVSIDGESRPTFYRELDTLGAHGISVSSVPAIYYRLCQKAPVEYIDSSWLSEAIQSSTSSYQRICKRTMDLAICLLGLPWFMLLFPLIALAIKLDSSGPVFYRQSRSGMGGKPFQMLKFRSMFTDDGTPRRTMDGKPLWTDENDPRITRVGLVLRTLHLDELPQLINIFLGDMSIIGPRPELSVFVPELEKELPHYRARLLVPPGLTGWAQIKHGYANSVDDSLVKLQYDVYYVLHWSVWLDLYILFNTIRVVVQGR